MNNVGKGRTKVFLKKEILDSDIVLILGGGEKSHIGGVVVCEPGKDPKEIRLGTHHDYVVLAPLAKYACGKYNKTSVAVGGIHIDNAKSEEIKEIIDNCKKLSKFI